MFIPYIIRAGGPGSPRSVGYHAPKVLAYCGVHWVRCQRGPRGSTAFRPKPGKTPDTAVPCNTRAPPARASGVEGAISGSRVLVGFGAHLVRALRLRSMVIQLALQQLRMALRVRQVAARNRRLAPAHRQGQGLGLFFPI